MMMASGAAAGEGAADGNGEAPAAFGRHAFGSRCP